MTDDLRILRQRMVEKHVAGRGVRDRRVLEAMSRVPRHRFLAGKLEKQAYSSHALPIGAGQTISQPYLVARMTEWLEVGPEHSVLEIGTGSGYQTAVLALLARRVYSLERIPELAREAIARIREFGLTNVKIQAFDGTIGWSEVGPFDRILVTAGAPSAPPALLSQLREGGRMIVPEGSRSEQRLVLYEKSSEGIRRVEGEEVSFVPLVGRQGWED